MHNKKIFILSLLFLIITMLIAVICFIPPKKEVVKNTYIETTENITKSTYNQETTFVIEEEILVWISKTGKRYHSIPDCSNMKNPLQVTIEEAEIRDYTPCMRCYRQ